MEIVAESAPALNHRIIIAFRRLGSIASADYAAAPVCIHSNIDEIFATDDEIEIALVGYSGPCARNKVGTCDIFAGWIAVVNNDGSPLIDQSNRDPQIAQGSLVFVKRIDEYNIVLQVVSVNLLDAIIKFQIGTAKIDVIPIAEAYWTLIHQSMTGLVLGSINLDIASAGRGSTDFEIPTVGTDFSQKIYDVGFGPNHSSFGSPVKKPVFQT